MKLRVIITCFFTVLLLFAGFNFPVGAENFSGNFVNINNGYEQTLEIGYPSVDKLEQKIFGTVYSDQNIYSRLDRLEKSVFGSVNKASLSERVDKLSEVVYSGGTYTADKGSSRNSNIIIGQNYRGYRSYNNINSGEHSTVLYDLENQLLGTAYPGEPLNTRLTRLESRVFSDSMEGYPVEERVQRLTAYADAKENDDFYQDQSQIKQYNNIVKGANALSLIFMILQLFL